MEKPVRPSPDAKNDGKKARRPRPKLLDQVRGAIRTRHYSRSTEDAYVSWIKRFIFFHKMHHPLELGAAEVTSFLTYLALERQVSASTQNQALNALIFLYKEVLDVDLPWLSDVVRARAPRRLPVVLAREEVKRLLDCLSGTKWLMASLLYGSGLRLLQCARLRVKDLDFSRHQIIVRGGKGNKDRATVLPAALHASLVSSLEKTKAQHLRDLDRGAGWVALPGALNRKYPGAGHEWAWQWVFPATRSYRDHESGQVRRHHLHESVLQRAVKEAVLRARITKNATCHSLRHNAGSRIMPGGIR